MGPQAAGGQVPRGTEPFLRLCVSQSLGDRKLLFIVGNPPLVSPFINPWHFYWFRAPKPFATNTSPNPCAPPPSREETIQLLFTEGKLRQGS